MKNTLYFIGKMFIVGMIHFVLLFGLYFLRVKREIFPAIDTDLVVFLLPSVLAFGAYFYFIWRDMFSTLSFTIKLSLTPLVAIIALFISFSCFEVIAFNIWGT